MGTDEEQARSLNDYLASSYETLKSLKKRRRKRIFIIILVGIFLIFIFFYSSFSNIFVAKKPLRFYEVEINNSKVSVSEKINNTTIIPVILVIPNGNRGIFTPKDLEKEIPIPGETYSFTIKSSTCFLSGEGKKVPISCNEHTALKYENSDTSYPSMQILKYEYDKNYKYSLSTYNLSRSYYKGENSIYTRPYEEYSVIYDAKFINDLTPYITQTGVYVMKVNFKYPKAKGSIYFGVVNDGQNIYPI